MYTSIYRVLKMRCHPVTTCHVRLLFLLLFLPGSRPDAIGLNFVGRPFYHQVAPQIVVAE